LDGEAPRVASGWFRSVEDSTPLPAVGPGLVTEPGVE